MEFIVVALILLVYMSLWFGVGYYRQNNSLVKLAWGPGMVLIAWLVLSLLSQSFLPRQMLISGMVTIWGVKSFFTLAPRIWFKPEDKYYQSLRKTWKSNVAVHSFLQVYMLEGLAMFIVALPIILTNANYSSKLNTLDYVGICVWLIGLFIEIIADYQLLKFRRTHKSGELKTGLWAYATHPKYIGEVLVWSGVFLVSLSVPGAWWGVISPIFVAYYLFQFKKLRLNTHSRT